MRPLCLLASFALSCTADVQTSDDPPASVRDRLEDGATQIDITPSDSAGAIAASRRASDGWLTGIVDLHIDSGELVVSADASGIQIEHFELALAPIDIPTSVIGHPAQLTQVRVDVAGPVHASTTWIDDNEARGVVRLDLALSWALTIDETTIILGAPDLPPVPVELVLTGDGGAVHGVMRVESRGALWSWANLLKLEDLTLIVAGETHGQRGN